MAWRWVLLVACMLLAVLPAWTQVTETPEPPSEIPRVTPDRVHPTWAGFQPEFHAYICPFPVPGDYNPSEIVCGYVLVPEDRSHAESRLIQLSVLVIKSTSENPELGAIMRLTGGPGGPSLGAGRVRAYQSPANRALREKADLVFFDQRGVGYSEGAFCRALPLPYQYGLPVTPEGFEVYEREVRRCFEEARARGVFVEGYTNWQNALDVRDIRRALGYETWNLFGVSYGTELAQGVMRVDTDGVHAVILDSVVPQGLAARDLDQITANGFRSALDAMTQMCRADPACAAEYEDLGARFLAAMAGFAEAPLILENVAPTAGQERIILDGRTIGDAVFQALYSHTVYGDLPALLHVLETRDVETLRTYVDVLGYPLDHAYGSGMSVTINCRGGFRQRVDAPPPPGPDGTALLAHIGSTNFARNCAAVFEASEDPTASPLVSEIPTLITTGAVDPITPPYYADLVLPGLANAQRLDFPHTGHGALLTHWDNCGRDTLIAFFSAPMAALDQTCPKSVSTPDFLVKLRHTKAPYHFARGLQAGRYPILTLTALGILATLVFVFPFTMLARRMDSTNSAEYGRARLLTAVGSALSIAGCTLAVGSVLATAASHQASLPVGVPASIGWAGWLGLAGCLLCFTALWRVWQTRSPDQRLGTRLAIGLGVLASAILLWFLFSIDAGPILL
ncbi:MAG: alpha/beta hydrolase [Hyphomonadaceae bacterium]|nr:alpha/beta hydrolase [Hyphomonadaceae bacterium]